MEQQCRHGKANLMLRNLFTLKNQQDLYDGFTVGVDLIQKKKKKTGQMGQDQLQVQVRTTRGVY